MCLSSVELGSKGKRVRARKIDVAAIENAKKAHFPDRVMCLNNLVDKLRENRMRRVVEPVVGGSGGALGLLSNESDWVVDLGLVRTVDVEIANPICREIVPRQLTHTTERSMAHRTAWYVISESKFDANKHLDAFFWAYGLENSEHCSERSAYKKGGPQLLLQAFLKRLVNGGGRIEREYGLERGRTDSLILWPKGDNADPILVDKHAIERKVIRIGRDLEEAIRAGLQKTGRHMDRCGPESAPFVIVDVRAGRSWDGDLSKRSETIRSMSVAVSGM